MENLHQQLACTGREVSSASAANDVCDREITAAERAAADLVVSRQSRSSRGRPIQPTPTERE